MRKIPTRESSVELTSIMQLNVLLKKTVTDLKTVTTGLVLKIDGVKPPTPSNEQGHHERFSA